MIRALAPLALLLAGLLAIWIALVPYDPSPQAWPGPDLVFVLAAAAALHRPAAAPLWATVVLGLAADLLLARPLGLGALALLLALEFLRPRAAMLRAGPFLAEWAGVAAAGAAALLAMNAALALAFLDPPPLGTIARQAASTALAYPLVALALGARRERTRP